MRLTTGAALVALVAVGAVLAELEPIVIVALTAAACVLVALVGRAYARERVPARDERPVAEESPSEELAAPELAEVEDAEPELAVSERSARAILASGPPPVHAAPLLEPEREPAPDLEPEPQPEPEPSSAPREWNIWELQRLVRERPDDDRHEEWAAL
ncbi:MAG: hypothetical protein K0S82_1864, partial [Gaiellaceae bacterium]|nr:hypothetical protein [Gaiellaceae bacterium]